MLKTIWSRQKTGWRIVAATLVSPAVEAGVVPFVVAAFGAGAGVVAVVTAAVDVAAAVVFLRYWLGAKVFSGVPVLLQ